MSITVNLNDIKILLKMREVWVINSPNEDGDHRLVENAHGQWSLDLWRDTEQAKVVHLPLSIALLLRHKLQDRPGK